MDIKLQRESLLKPLQNVIGVVERKQTLPILANVLVRIQGDEISITGTDLEVELSARSKLEIEHSHSTEFTVSGRKLLDICKALPEEAPIELNYQDQRLAIKSGRSRFTLSTLSAIEFPKFEAQEKHLSFNIAQREFLQLIQRSCFAMAQQDVRYYLNGMLFEATTGSLRAVATDGHRLATNFTQLAIPEIPRLQIIVPRKGIVELLRLLTDSDGTVEITIGGSQIRVAHENFIFTSKLVEGRFPDYDRVIPKNSDKTILLERDELKQALQRASILCNEKFRGIRLELHTNMLRIVANNPEQEIAEEELIIDYQHEELSIGFNVNYLLDILNTAEPGNIKMSFTDSNSSVLIEEEQPLFNALFVVMPMRL